MRISDGKSSFLCVAIKKIVGWHEVLLAVVYGVLGTDAGISDDAILSAVESRSLYKSNLGTVGVLQTTMAAGSTTWAGVGYSS